MSKPEILAEREFFAWWKRGAMRYLDNPQITFTEAFQLGYEAHKREKAKRKRGVK